MPLPVRRLSVPVRQRILQLPDVNLQVGDRGEQLLPVVQKDLPPQSLGTDRDPRRVAIPAPGEGGGAHDQPERGRREDKF